MTQTTLGQGLQSAKNLISNFLNSDHISDLLLTAFGDLGSAEALGEQQRKWRIRDRFSVATGLSVLQSAIAQELTVEVVDRAKINGANGAYSGSNNTIYLATELVANGDIDAITRTLLEEIGHYLDRQINSSDAPGDEGAIFAALVLGDELSNEQLETLQAEDDTAVVELDGESRLIEQDEIIFVDANALGARDGTSWENAYTSLQNGLNNATAGDEIWVADGTYVPTTTENRETSFDIPSNVKVYGGFAGGETELDARNARENITILSGDIGISGDNTDNSFNVVTLNEVESETLLDGFTITGGNADDDSTNRENNSGGGISASNSNASVTNLIIANNNAFQGAGMFSEDSQHQITNVAFIENTASAVGGGLSITDSSETLENVTFAYNSAGSNGGAIENSRSVINLNNLEFIANQAGNYGGAIYNEFNRNASFSLTDSVFLNNVASGRANIGNTRVSRGGAIYSEEFSGSTFQPSTENVISNTIFKGSSADFGGAIFNDNITFKVTDSLFTDNFSIAGASVYNLRNNFEVVNSTFTDNLSQFASGVASEESTTNITNSIFWNNQTTYESSSITNSDSTTEVSFSLVEGGYDGTEVITEDPQFVEPNSFDYRLSSGSPAIDIGNNDAVSSEEDLAGNSRIIDNTVDLGAYEGVALDPVPTEPQISAETSIIYVDADASGENNGTSWDNAYTNLRTALNNAPSGSQVWVAEGTYTPSQDNRELSFQLKNAVAVYGGFSGSETELDRRNLVENQTILSGEIGDTSTIDDNSYHVVNASDVTNSTILDGFTIRDGNANGEVNLLSIDSVGGGIFSNNSHAVFNNLRLENNRAINAGGVYVDGTSSHIFTNIDFVGNSATDQAGAVFSERGNLFFFDSNFRNNTAPNGGGAIFTTESSIYIEGATFDGNETNESGGAILLTGGISIDDAPQKIVNSIFTNNTAKQGGAISSAAVSLEGVNLTFVDNQAEKGAAVFTAAFDGAGLSVPEYYNSIFWNNTGTVEDEQIFNEVDPVTVRNSIVQGGYEGENIIDANPEFVNQEAGNLRISSNSSAVNAGLNNVVLVEEDIADRPRINSDTVDIGAYEFTEGDNDSGTRGNDDNNNSDSNGDDNAQTIELFRFRNTTFDTGTYLFVGAGERDAILNNPDFNQTFELEGQAFTASEEEGDDLIPFYRLQSRDTPGTYLFVSTGEYDAIFNEDSDQRDKWTKEGLDDDDNDVAEFYLYNGSADRGVDFNRFQNTQNNTFLYAGPTETEAIENNSDFASLFNNQGVAFESL